MDIILLYLWTRLDQFFFAMWVVFIGAILMLGGVWLVRLVREDSTIGDSYFRKAWWTIIAVLSLNMIVPTKSSVALILGGSAVLEAARSDSARRIASKSVQLIEQTLDGYLKKDAK